LFESGFKYNDFNRDTLEQIVVILRQALDEGKGIVGFGKKLTDSIM
jgi:hypothetical protein